MVEATDGRGIRLGYLTSEYPAVSHTFVQREVRALRAHGVAVETMSIRPAAGAALLTRDDRDEAGRTWTILPITPGEFLRAHLSALVRGPTRYLRMVARALSLSGAGVRAKVWQLFYAGEAIVLWQRMRAQDLRHVHVHFANAGADIAMHMCAYANRPRDRWSWSFTLHGTFAIATEFGGGDQYRLEEKVRRASFVVCISEFGRSQLLAMVDAGQWPSIHVVRCGLDDRWLASPPDRSAQNTDRFDVLCVGRMVPLKGHAVLLDAIAELRARGVDATLTLVGDGPERPKLERQVAALGLSDHVAMPGSVGQETLGAWYAAADAFCLASFSEGIPVVVMEAMATELAVVATRVGGVAELVESEVTGLLVDPGRATPLADALERLARDPDLRGRLGRAGRLRVGDDYVADRSAGVLVGLFAQIPGTRPAG